MAENGANFADSCQSSIPTQIVALTRLHQRCLAPKTSPPKQELEGHGPAGPTFNPKFAYKTFFRGGQEIELEQERKTLSSRAHQTKQAYLQNLDPRLLSGSDMCVLNLRFGSKTVAIDRNLIVCPLVGKTGQSWSMSVCERGAHRCLTDREGGDENSMGMQTIVALIMR